MKIAYFAATALAATLAAAPASAATNLDLSSGTADFANASTSSGTFNDVYTFTVGAGSTSAAVISTLLRFKDVTITSVLLDTTPFERLSTGSVELWNLEETAIAAGTHSFTVIGNWGTQGGTYSGTVNYAAAAVPESATWAMMLIGFGAVGAGLRRRRSNVTTTVKFA